MWIPLTTTCHDLVFQLHMSVFFMLNGLMLEVAIHFVNIDEIAYHYHLTFFIQEER